jgi:TDG/mug DNA glycosylase family protein
LRYGYGITNIVKRATASASELTKEELIDGSRLLKNKVRKFKPNWLAVVGVSAYRTAFEVPDAKIGLQKNNIGSTMLWVLPNPSGLNAHHQLPQLIQHFSELRDYISK